MSTQEQFFELLPSFNSFDQFTNLAQYQPLPDGWLVIVTDITNSTEAIEKGLYRAVNAASTASVVAVLNVFKQLSLPYVFGGDGINICIPATRLDEVRSALAASQKLAKNSFGLELRVGMVPVQHVREQGQEILIGKYQPTPHFRQAMFQGGGLAYAESLIKHAQEGSPYLLPEGVQPSADFTGFECRWNEVPSSKEENVTLIVQVLERDHAGHESADTYQEIFHTIQSIYGSETDFHPVSPEQLGLTFAPGKLMIEARIRRAFDNSWSRIKYMASTWLLNLAGYYLMTRKRVTQATNWGEYKKNLVMNTDYRKFDGTLRLVISGTAKQRKSLESYLEQMHTRNKIVYGTHVSASSIFTCIVSDYNFAHVHFLDGSNGGYAMAAKKMKVQIRKMEKLNREKRGEPI